MSKTDSIWVKVQLKSPHDKFYDFFRNHLKDLIHIFPEQFQSIELVEGESLSAGSVIQFKFLFGHRNVTEKWIMRAVNDAKKYIIYDAVEGEMLKHYKVLRAKVETVNGGLSKVGSGGFAKWTVEFEKANENVPSPESYIELFEKISKGVDAYFSKNKN